MQQHWMCLKKNDLKESGNQAEPIALKQNN
jgi:hypothetical protein